MKAKKIVLINNKIHERERSYDMCIIMIVNEYADKNVRVRLTYESYNAVERFNGETFDGIKWNNIFCLPDLGVLPDTSMYIRDSSRRIERVKELTEKAYKYIDTIL